MEMINIRLAKDELSDLIKYGKVLIGDMVETTCDNCLEEVNLDIMVTCRELMEDRKG